MSVTIQYLNVINHGQPEHHTWNSVRIPKAGNTFLIVILSVSNATMPQLTWLELFSVTCRINSKVLWWHIWPCMTSPPTTSLTVVFFPLPFEPHGPTSPLAVPKHTTHSWLWKNTAFTHSQGPLHTLLWALLKCLFLREKSLSIRIQDLPSCCPSFPFIALLWPTVATINIQYNLPALPPKKNINSMNKRGWEKQVSLIYHWYLQWIRAQDHTPIKRTTASWASDSQVCPSSA